MSEGNGLPKGWARTSLDSVGKLHCGQSPSVSDVNVNGSGTPYVTGPDQWDGNTLTVDKWTTNPRRRVPDGCIFITVKGAGVGTLFAGVACAIGRDVYAYEPLPGLNAKFIEHSLRHNIAQVLRHAKGDIPGLSKGHILGHLTAFPPLNEQHRIVAKIEELFSDLDAGVAALERAKANLKRYRAAVLKAAVEGKLTEDWRAKHPKTEPASKLLERILAERRKKWEADQLAKFNATGKEPPRNWKAKYVEPMPPDTDGLPRLPDNWSWVSWEQVLAFEEGAFKRGPFGSTLTKAIFVPMGYKVYEQYCPINDDCSFARYFITEDKFRELESFAVRSGDYLISCSGVTLGRITKVPELFEKGIINQALLRVRINTNIIRNNYFVRLFRSPFFQRLIFANSTGSAIPNVKGVKELKAIPLPLPPLDEQDQLIGAIDETLSQIEAAETAIGNDLLRAARLRQSILKQAFEGKLVPQDPKDEPANVLLERLQTCQLTHGANGTEPHPTRTRGRRARAKQLERTSD